MGLGIGMKKHSNIFPCLKLTSSVSRHQDFVRDNNFGVFFFRISIANNLILPSQQITTFANFSKSLLLVSSTLFFCHFLLTMEYMREGPRACSPAAIAA